jgi:hypothetical protein
MTAMTKGSRNDRWLAAMMNGPVAGDVLAPDAAQAPVEVEEGLQDRP